jgi:SHS2 domain-containing protein
VTGGPPRYEPFEHTAEAGIIARGATLAEAFGHAAEGMYALMLELDSVQEREHRDITLEAAGHEQLLVDWLLELLFLTETQDLVFRRFEVRELSETHLAASAFGEPFDRKQHHSHNVMVKAVTRHMLEIERENDRYRIQVLFDV